MACTSCTASYANAQVFAAEAEPRWQANGSEVFSEVSSAAESSGDGGNQMSARGGKSRTTMRERQERQLMLKNKMESALQGGVVTAESGLAFVSEVSTAAECTGAASGYYSSEADGKSSPYSSEGTDVALTRQEQMSLKVRKALSQGSQSGRLEEFFQMLNGIKRDTDSTITGERASGY